MYYRSGTGETLTHGRSADAKFSFSRWQHSAWNDVVAAILKLWRHIKKIRLRQSIRIHLENNNPPNFTRSDLKRRSLGLFEDGRPIKEA